MLPSIGSACCAVHPKTSTVGRGAKSSARYFLFLLVLVVPSAFAGDLPPADAPLTDAIDQCLRDPLTQTGITAVARTNDRALLRRTTLDLAGRIPTAAEREWFLKLPDEIRQTQLVDRLMNLPDFDFHHRNWLDELLLPNRPYDAEFRDYLLSAVQNRRAWDVMFREMMAANVVDGPDKGASQFLKSRVKELDDLTNDTAVLFFGVNVSCAKCHDHPLVPDWKQDHFYGMQAFFQRTYATRKSNAIAERPFGEVKFASVSGEERKAGFMFLTGDTIPDQTPEYTEEERKQLEERVKKLERDDEEAELFVPAFRPREALVEVALLDTTDRFFARNIVNRVWARLLGVGLVDPADQLHSGNPSSHPQLLEWLTLDLVAHNYDLRRLIRGIVLSEAYARSGEWSSDAEPPPAQTFAIAQTRPLTPRQLALSLLVAVRNPEQWPSIEQTDEWIKLRTDLENQANNWVREFEQPTANFQIAVDEALFFSNNERVQNELLRDSDDRLLGRLKKSETSQQSVEQLWQTILCRLPHEDEMKFANDWLDRDPQKIDESRRQLLWVLLAGPEFRFNY